MEMKTMNNEKNGMQRPPFHVAMTADLSDETGKPKFADVGLDVLERHPHIEVSSFDQHRSIIEPGQLNGAHGVAS